MGDKAFKEILIFVLGTTPQIITETLYALTQECAPPVFPDEIHVITTTTGRERIEQELILNGRLDLFQKEFNLPSIPLSTESIHVIQSPEGQPLEDIREASHNEAVGDFIVNLIREKAEDDRARLHCSLAGGRKTMSFYLGSALQLFGRPRDKLYHVLVTPEFESHPHFYYKPVADRILEIKGSAGNAVLQLNTKDARITLTELPYVRLRDKIVFDRNPFRELIKEGQKEIDIASIQPGLRVRLKDRVIYIADVDIDLVPIQMVIYGYFLRRKTEACQLPQRPYCLDCTECFPYLGDLSKRKAFDEMAKDYRLVYGESSGRVDEFLRRWEKRGAVDVDILRQNISKINKTIKESLRDETLLPYFLIIPIGKHGSKRYGVKAEKGKILIEQT